MHKESPVDWDELMFWALEGASLRLVLATSDAKTRDRAAKFITSVEKHYGE